MVCLAQGSRGHVVWSCVLQSQNGHMSHRGIKRREVVVSEYVCCDLGYDSGLINGAELAQPLCCGTGKPLASELIFMCNTGCHSQGEIP